MITSLFQIVIGFSGLIGYFLRFIGPLTIAPTITLMGISLFDVAAEHAGNYYNLNIVCLQKMKTLVLYNIITYFSFF